MEKITKNQLKSYIKGVIRESLSECEYKDLLKEVSPPGEKAERMIQHVKASLRDAHPNWGNDKITSVAIATGWKAHNAGSVEEAYGSPMDVANFLADTRGWDKKGEQSPKSGDPRRKALAKRFKKGLKKYGLTIQKKVDEGGPQYKIASPTQARCAKCNQAREIQYDPEMTEQIAKVALNESYIRLGVGVPPNGLVESLREHYNRLIEFFGKRGYSNGATTNAIKDVMMEANKGKNSEYASPKFLKEFQLFRENAKKFGIDKALEIDESSYKQVSPNETDISKEDKARTIQTNPKVTENHKVQHRSSKTVNDLDNDPQNVRDPEIPQA